MNVTLSESLAASLRKLDELNAQHLQLGEEMLKAYGGALYGMDLLASAALNRSMALIAGFRTLIDQRNLICAGALLRVQLDTALRFFASFIVEKPHDFAMAVLAGKRVRDLTDRAGKKMTDTYLVSKLADEYDWVRRVYERTSGYVHLSSTHFMSIFSRLDAGESEPRFECKISAKDKPLPDWIYIEAADAFCAATEILLRYIEGWVFTKANPEMVARLKTQRPAP